MKKRGPVIVLVVVALLLLIPLISMQFTNEVNWDSGDFLIAAALLFSTGMAVDLVIRKVKSKKHRISLSITILLILIIIWLELAVGLFETAFAGS